MGWSGEAEAGGGGGGGEGVGGQVEEGGEEKVLGGELGRREARGGGKGR